MQDKSKNKHITNRYTPGRKSKSLDLILLPMILGGYYPGRCTKIRRGCTQRVYNSGRHTIRCHRKM